MDIKRMFILCLALVFALVAPAGTAVNAAADGGEATVERTLRLKNFKGVSSELAVNIVYTQGSGYKVVVSGRSCDLDRADFRVDGDMLKVSLKKDYKKSRHDDNEGPINLVVTAPTMERVVNYGRMSFMASSFSVDGFSMENSGRLDVNVKTVSGGPLIIRNYSQMSLSSASVKTTEVSMENSGRLDVNIKTVADGPLIIRNYSQMSLSSTSVKATELSMENSGSLEVNVKTVESGKFGINNFSDMSFIATGVKAARAEFSNSGSLDINHDKAWISSSLDISNYSQMSVKGDISANDAEYSNSGVYDFNGNIYLKDGYKHVNYGNSSFTGAVKASRVDISNSGVEEMNVSIEASRLGIQVYGRSDFNLRFKGGDASLECSGSGKVFANVDCRAVSAKAFGEIVMKLSGTADKTEFNSSGKVNIDTSGLNNF